MSSPAGASLSVGWEASAVSMSEVDRGKEDGEQAVQDDDDEDRFHHRGGDVLAERFALPPTFMPSTDPMMR